MCAAWRNAGRMEISSSEVVRIGTLWEKDGRPESRWEGKAAVQASKLWNGQEHLKG